MRSEDETEPSRRLLPKRKRRVLWKLIVAVLAVVVVVAAVMVLKPWERLGEGNDEAGENVLFQYQANFAYLGSEDNLPIENVGITLPCPNIENEGVMAFMDTRGYTRTLYWQDNENMLYPQTVETPILILENGETYTTDNVQVYELRFPRTSAPEIRSRGDFTIDGPKINYVLDKLYTREVFCVSNVVSVPQDKAERVTLRNYGDNEWRSSAGYYYPYGSSPPGEPINLLFWIQLSKKVGENYEVVETFSRTAENAEYGWWWLY